MTWRALIAGDRRLALASVVRDIVTAIDEVPAARPDEHVDRALLRAYAAVDDIVPDPADVSASALATAIRELATTRTPPGLLGGAAGVGFAVAHLASGDDAELVCARIDELLLTQLSAWQGDHDFVSGAAGIGVYALERGGAGRALATAVIDCLARLSRRRFGGLAWHTAPTTLPPWQLAVAPDGYWNYGVAHGTPGVIGVLARFVDAGIEGARELLAGAVTFLLAAEPKNDAGRYPGWRAGRADGTPSGHDETGLRRSRLAWCYGDLGASIALYAAATAMNDASWRDEALAMARACATRTNPDANVFDAGLCHGAMGVAHLFNRLSQATGDATFETTALRWLEHGLALRNDQPYAGFPKILIDEGVSRWEPDATLLAGAIGVALTLCSMITDHEPSWDRILLADVR
jgi:hypothetical protein